MYDHLKMKTFHENIRIFKEKLVVLTWGNVSCIDRNLGVICIKPSGIPYQRMNQDDMVIVDMNGEIINSNNSPSSDLPTHLYLYKAWPHVNGIVHTHSTYATMFAQAKKLIPCFGTTHADVFHTDVPVTNPLKIKDITKKYESNIGKNIVEYFLKLKINSETTPGILVSSHGPFVWGTNITEAVENAITLEEIAKMALGTLQLNSETIAIEQELIDKHYFRKHGKGAYYGQGKS